MTLRPPCEQEAGQAKQVQPLIFVLLDHVICRKKYKLNEAYCEKILKELEYR